MSLQKQMIPIELGQGLDTKTDSKQAIAGKLYLLENATFAKRKQLDKRNGYRALSRLTTAGAELPNGDALEVYNDELLQYAGQRLYSYSAGSDRWIDKGPVVSAIVKTRQIIKNTAEQTQADSAYANGVTVYAWQDSRGGVRASVIDEDAGTTIIADVSLDSSASRVRCLAFRNFLYVFYYKSGALYVRRLNPREPTAFEAAVTVSSTVDTTNPHYDVIALRDQRILWAHNNDDGDGDDEIKAGWLDDTPSVLSGVLAPKIIVDEAAKDGLAIVFKDSKFYFAWANGSTLESLITNVGLVELGAATLGTPAAQVLNLTGHGTSQGAAFFAEITAMAKHDHYIVSAHVGSDGSIVSSLAVFLRSVGLASKAFVFKDSDGAESGFVGIVHDSPLQATFFVARTSDGLIVAKQQPNAARGLITNATMPSVWSRDGKEFAWSITNKTQILSENARIYTPTGVARTSLDFGSIDVFSAAQLGQNLHIVGGVLSMYDGQSVVEHGFHLYPETVSVSAKTTGGSLEAATYSIMVLYEWTDNAGQVHRSAPSVASVVTTTGTTGSIEVTVPTLRLTSKKGNRTGVSIVGYIAEGDSDGSVFYRFTSVSTPIMNDPTVDTVKITATTVTISNEILYTVGGVLEHIGAPSSSAITIYKNRVVLAGLESANDVWFSKEYRTGEAVGFSEELKKTVEPAGGGIVGVAKIDDKLIMLKSGSIYFTSGDGPNNTGAFGEFTEPQQVPQADVGLLDAQSIVPVPAGVIFKSSKGIYLLDPSLTPSYIGAEVEAYNSLKITAATLVADRNQIRFTSESGVCLVYDYYFQQWSTFTNHDAKDAVTWQGTYMLLKANSGAIWREDRACFKDAGAPIRVRLGIGWLSLAGVTGFQRVYRIAVLGEYKSPHILSVQVGYDFSSAYSDTILFNPDTALGISRFGDGVTFGSEKLFGGESCAYRFSAHLRIQKCQAIRLLIEEQTTAATEGSHEAFSISTIGLLVGGKAGFGKFKANQKLGASR